MVTFPLSRFRNSYRVDYRMETVIFFGVSVLFYTYISIIMISFRPINQEFCPYFFPFQFFKNFFKLFKFPFSLLFYRLFWIISPFFRIVFLFVVLY